ncbi:translation factor [Lindgomyces ingoldianus]|uniref:Translation factor n=1 Tax=Lindgomyces ingoldianus TaxID=673940 RepID=A0ACB6QW04_9PLEO|nr:translation factor [Lindgomyces ingoldianus]KAF2470753.1 translation factor [Lindgomyces ingoldianus]
MDDAARSGMTTRILPIDRSHIYDVSFDYRDCSLDSFDFSLREGPTETHLKIAAEKLLNSDIPVAFPTETVYGLGAIATKSSAVQGIFKVKGRPVDNPLIVHVCSVQQLRQLLQPTSSQARLDATLDPIPNVYKSLIEKFWPGPLTILLPCPENSELAPEVHPGLKTFSVRIPDDPLALALIQLSGPIAAPSANASTRPSTTTAQHVKDDLEGKIEIILDGGTCAVGLESTVVDGLSNPPCILRPGGISLQQIRQCEGWEGVIAGYDCQSTTIPKAPGMKYRHYSPRASVILYEAGSSGPILEDARKVGVIRTMKWESQIGGDAGPIKDSLIPIPIRSPKGTHWEVWLGDDLESIARGLFAALRHLDDQGVDAIHVEGIPETDDLAATIMNRLRKAAIQICT